MTSEEIWNDLEDAYVFAFPLVLSNATTRATTELASPADPPLTNRLLHSRRLANANTKSVVTPNVDTLYSQVFFDLKPNEAFVLHKPTAERFLSIELLDAWTNCVRVLGTAGDTEEARTYLVTGPTFEGDIPDNLVQVALPTAQGWAIARTVVMNENDFPDVYCLQEKMLLLPFDQFVKKGLTSENHACELPSDQAFVPIRHVMNLSPQEFFDTANALMLANPPAKEDGAELDRLRSVSIGPGLSFDASILGENAAVRWHDLHESLLPRLLDQSTQFVEQHGIWHMYGKPIAEYRTEYAYRALIAYAGLGANPVSVAVYPKAETDGGGEPLDGNHKYRVRFDTKALRPNGKHGFWSLTAYGSDNFLIDNEIDRYLINDRSGFTLDDGSLTLFVQADPPVAKHLQNNWLPVKKEPFHLHLRIYLPTDDVLDGIWPMPTIERVC